MSKTETTKNISSFELPDSGIKVEIDKCKNNGNTLFKARRAVPDGNIDETTLFIISEISTFNGQKMAAPEIKNLSAFDIMELEQQWVKLRGKK